MSLADAFHGRNVLVTGGLGFLGSNLAIKLVRYGANVTILDSLIPQFGGSFFNIAPVRDQVVVNISDMRDAELARHPGAGQGLHLQPGRPGQPRRQHARSAARPGRQLRLDDEPGRGLPQAQPRRAACCTPRRGRSTAGRKSCR